MALVAYLTHANPHLAESGFGVPARVAIIGSLLATGAYMMSDATRRRLGAMVLGTGLLACVWLLNGSARSLPFTVGMAAAPLMVSANCLLLLVHPRGYLRTRNEAVFLAIGTSLLSLLWWTLLLTSSGPPLKTPLLQCGAHCPSNLLFVTSTPSVAGTLKGLALATWTALYAGTGVVLWRRMGHACGPARRMLLPVTATAVAQLLLLVGFLIAESVDGDSAHPVGTVYVAVVAVIPAAIFVGLALERQFLGLALARFIGLLARAGSGGVQATMAEALEDPSLEILYRSERTGAYVDAQGVPHDAPGSRERRSVVEVAGDGEAIGLVLFDAELGDMRLFVTAAAEAASLALRADKLQAEVAASYREQRDARLQAMSAVVSERARIQRDLHDSAQQRLLAIRSRIRNAEQELLEDVPRLKLLRSMEVEVEEVFDDLRDVIARTYPAVLADFGLAAALRAACRRHSPTPRLTVNGLARYPAGIEPAVYFTCVEALQNIAKHAGLQAAPSVSLRDAGDALYFDVADRGPGLAASAAEGQGFTNMRERIQSVDGQLTIRSRADGGTIVSGRVPLPRRGA